MNINELITIVKKKLQNNIDIKSIKIEDKSFLHKKHAGNQKGKFHLKITIKSDHLIKLGKLNSNRIVFKLLEKELKKYIHSIQILIF